MRQCYLCKKDIKKEETWAYADFHSGVVADDGTVFPKRLTVHLKHQGVRRHCGLPEVVVAEPPSPERDDSAEPGKRRPPHDKGKGRRKDKRRGRRPKPKA